MTTPTRIGAVGTFNELSWLVDFCCRLPCAEEVLQRLAGHPAHLWILGELLDLQGNDALLHELDAIGAGARGEAFPDGVASSDSLARDRAIMRDVLSNRLGPFVEDQQTVLLAAIEQVRAMRIPSPHERAAAPVVFGHDASRVALRYWRWGKAGASTSTVVFYPDDESVLNDYIRPSALDLLDRMESSDGHGSLHFLHAGIMDRWPNLALYPHWFLRGRYSVFGREAEVWMRFTDAYPEPVRVVMEHLAVAR